MCQTTNEPNELNIFAIFETFFSFDKDIWIAATDYYMLSYMIVPFLLTAILQLINFILYLCIHFLSLKCYFLYLNIIWTFI